MMDYRVDQRLRIRHLVLRLAVAVVAATIVLGAIILLLRGQIAVALHWYVITIGVLVLIALDRFIVGVYPVLHRSILDSVWQARPETSKQPSRLQELEHQISVGSWSGANTYRCIPKPPCKFLAASAEIINH
jgi:hypothetical protein